MALRPNLPTGRNGDTRPSAPVADVPTEKRVFCKCGADVTDLSAISGDAVHRHKLTPEHTEGLRRLAAEQGTGSSQNSPPGQPGQLPLQLRPPAAATRPQHQVPRGRPCRGISSAAVGFRQPFAVNYPWQMHAPTGRYRDVSIIWEATSEGRLYSNRCSRMLSGTSREMCAMCDELRFSVALRQFARQSRSPNYDNLANATFNQLVPRLQQLQSREYYHQQATNQDALRGSNSPFFAGEGEAFPPAPLHRGPPMGPPAQAQLPLAYQYAPAPVVSHSFQGGSDDMHAVFQPPPGSHHQQGPGGSGHMGTF